MPGIPTGEHTNLRVWLWAAGDSESNAYNHENR